MISVSTIPPTDHWGGEEIRYVRDLETLASLFCGALRQIVAVATSFMSLGKPHSVVNQQPTTLLGRGRYAAR